MTSTVASPSRSLALALTFLCAFDMACGGGAPAPPASTAGSGDAAFTALAQQILDDHYERHPSAATDLGLHQYDEQLEDVSEAAMHAESEALKRFRAKLAAVDPATLTLDKQLDREQLHARVGRAVCWRSIASGKWAKDPDSYSSAVTNAAYVIMKRDYAPAADRLKALIAREQKMPAALAEARKNLDAPPRIYTEIAIEQIDGNISFFKTDVPAAFDGRHRQGASR